MLPLIRRLRADPGRDRGAVAVTVGLLLAGGVLLGFLALVFDVGRLYVERGELQGGADAAAMAIAVACAHEDPSCDNAGSILDLAQIYANRNAKDRHTGITEVCGRLPGKLARCDTPNTNLTACLGAAPEQSSPYVEVRVHTQLGDGGTLLPPMFANTLLGNGGYRGTSVGACARASWGPGIGAGALAISTCDFNSQTRNGTRFGPEPPYNVTSSTVLRRERTIWARGSNVQSNCSTGVPGWSVPGPFVWLRITGDGDCTVDIPANGVFLPGRSVNRGMDSECSSMLRESRTKQIPVYVVIYDGVHRSGTTVTEYHAVAVAPFVVTGYYWSTTDRVRSWNRNPDAYPCSGRTDRCISGFFIGPSIPLASFDPNLTGIARLIG